ncbi:MAG: magnesium transporter MgtE N-terminal domain-containing protein [Shimia sp.]|uniref:magnesium transporter MgtE N-terminal domain-containing protein n=1 Tax=Shimia sp. TaxID=1954381 RepID=UPI004059BA58
MGTMSWLQDQDDAAREANKATVRRMDEMIASGQRDAVIAATSDWPPADALACLLQLRPSRARRLFDWLPDNLGLKVLAELDTDLYAVLYSRESERTFSNIIGMMDVDEAVDTFLELPRDFAARLVATRPDADRIGAVLQSRDDSAATVMRLGVLMAPVEWTVGQLSEDIRARSAEIAKIDMMFVVDPDRKPLGYLRFREVLAGQEDLPLTEILHPELEIVSADTDREEVLQLARRKGSHAIGVVDGLGKLVGGISPRELGDILRDEVEEDMLVMGSVSPATTQFDGPLTILKRRLPWLMGGAVWREFRRGGDRVLRGCSGAGGCFGELYSRCHGDGGQCGHSGVYRVGAIAHHRHQLARRLWAAHGA